MRAVALRIARYKKRILSIAFVIAVLYGLGAGYRYLRSPHLPPGSRIYSIVTPHISGIAFSPNSKQIAVIGWDTRLNLYSVETGKRINRWEISPRPQFDIAFSPKSQEVVVSHDVLNLTRWDLDKGKEILPPLWPPMVAGLVRYSPDGRYFAASSIPSAAVCVWDTATNRPHFAIRGFRNYPTSIDFSPDGKWLAVTDRTGCYLWNTATRQKTHFWPAKYLSFVEFSPDNTLIVFGGPFTPINIASMQDRRIRTTIAEYDIQRALFAPDSRYLVLAKGGNLLVYDTEGRFRGFPVPNLTPPGYLMRMFPPLRALQKLPIACLAFSPDGRHLAYAAADKLILLPVNSLKLP